MTKNDGKINVGTQQLERKLFKDIPKKFDSETKIVPMMPDEDRVVPLMEETNGTDWGARIEELNNAFEGKEIPNQSGTVTINVGDTYPYNGGNYRVVALLNDSSVQVKNTAEPFDAPIIPISVLLTKDMFGNA